MCSLGSDGRCRSTRSCRASASTGKGGRTLGTPFVREIPLAFVSSPLVWACGLSVGNGKLRESRLLPPGWRLRLAALVPAHLFSVPVKGRWAGVLSQSKAAGLASGSGNGVPVMSHWAGLMEGRGPAASDVRAFRIEPAQYEVHDSDSSHGGGSSQPYSRISPGGTTQSLFQSGDAQRS